MNLKHNVELENEQEFMLLYPNPTSDFVSVRYSYLAPYKTLELSITDALGKQVYNSVLSENKDELIIPLKNYTNGNYIVTITADKEIVYSEKVVKR